MCEAVTRWRHFQNVMSENQSHAQVLTYTLTGYKLQMTAISYLRTSRFTNTQHVTNFYIHDHLPHTRKLIARNSFSNSLSFPGFHHCCSKSSLSRLIWQKSWLIQALSQHSFSLHVTCLNERKKIMIIPHKDDIE